MRQIGFGFTSDYVDTLSQLCKRYYAIGRLADAEALAFQLRLVEPLNVEHYKLSALIQARMKEHQRAFNCYKLALLVEPYDAEVWLGLAKQSIYLEHMVDAMEYLDKAIEYAQAGTKLKTQAQRLRNMLQ